MRPLELTVKSEAQLRKVWTEADSALLERACASGKMDDGFPATDGRLAKALGCCRRTIIRQRQARQIVATAGPREGGRLSTMRRAAARLTAMQSPS